MWKFIAVDVKVGDGRGACIVEGVVVNRDGRGRIRGNEGILGREEGTVGITVA